MALRAILVASLLFAFASSAHADVSAAARAFADGQSAQLEGDYDHAAQSFELAYSNAPSKEALRSAVRARQLAGQLARAATLAEILLVQYAADPPSTKLANDVIGEARPKFGRVTIACAARCALAIGGRAMSLPAAETHVVYIAAGHQTLEATFDDARSATRDLTAVVGTDTEVRIEAPAPKVNAPGLTAEVKTTSDRPEPSDTGGLSPFVPLAGAAVAVGLAGIGIWSGIDTNKAHDAYVKMPTHEAFKDGQSKQLRTNILFGSAIVVGAASAAVAIVWTRWGSSEAPAISLAPLSGGGLVVYGADF
jgi:hypothetical protein